MTFAATAFAERSTEVRQANKTAPPTPVVLKRLELRARLYDLPGQTPPRDAGTADLPMTRTDAIEPATISVSGALRRAAASERKRIIATREHLDPQRAHMLAELDSEILGLDERLELLDRLVGPGEDTPELVATTTGCRLLRGAEIRHVACQLLYQQQGARHVIHYRDGLAWLHTMGYVLGAKNPPATFLTSIRRSSLLVRGEQPGTYYINDALASALRKQLASIKPSCAT